jgi:hypothetical protein
LIDHAIRIERTGRRYSERTENNEVSAVRSHSGRAARARQRLANISNEIDAHEEEAKRIAGEFKTKILEVKTRYGFVKTSVLTRREHREVICTEHFNTKRGEVYVVRDDLGTIVDARVMTDRERQLHLPEIEVPTDNEGHETVKTESNGKPEKRGRAARV